MDILKPLIIYLGLALLSVLSSTSHAVPKPVKKNNTTAAPQAAMQNANRRVANEAVEGKANPNSVAQSNGSSNEGSTVASSEGEGGSMNLLTTSSLRPSNGSDMKAITKKGAVVAEPGSLGSLFQDEKNFLAGLDYPELQVVPRASERLNLELQMEKTSVVSNYWPVQVAGVGLILAGVTSSGQYKETNPTDFQKKEQQFSTQLSLITGALWIGATYLLDHPTAYSMSQGDIKKITGKDKKSLLLKERLSEEALERPAKMARILNNMVVWSSLALSLYVNEHSSQTGLINYAALAAGLSFFPWLFENRYISNWEKHQEYKRKIYAPITRLDFTIDPQTQKIAPLIGMQWEF